MTETTQPHQSQTTMQSQQSIAVSQTQWYDKMPIVILLLLFCFPAGLIAIVMNRKASQKTKLIIAGIWMLFMIIFVLPNFNEARRRSEARRGTSEPASALQQEVQPSEQLPLKEPTRCNSEQLRRIVALLEIISNKDADVRCWDIITNAPIIDQCNELRKEVDSTSDEFKLRRKKKELAELVGTLRSTFSNVLKEASALLAQEYYLDIPATIKEYDFSKKRFPFVICTDLDGIDGVFVIVAPKQSCITIGGAPETMGSDSIIPGWLYADVGNFVKFETSEASFPDGSSVECVLGNGMFPVAESIAETVSKDRIRLRLKITAKKKSIGARVRQGSEYVEDYRDCYEAVVRAIQLVDGNGKSASTLR